jgi:hypothetical protein
MQLLVHVFLADGPEAIPTIFREVPTIMQMVIANRYKLEADWHYNWKTNEMGGKITLTPP